jgi:thymidylate kinase
MKICNNKHIIIDGPDGCSKTTMCKKLSKLTGYPIIKMKKTKSFFKKLSVEDASFIFFTTISQIPSNYPCIFDRGFMSSLVYAKIYNRKDNLDYINKIEKTMKFIPIILTATNEELFKRRPNDKVISNKIRYEIKKEYDRLALEKKYHLIDTTHNTRSEVLNKILKTIKQYD